MPIVAKYNLNGNANAQVGTNGTANNMTWGDGVMNGAGVFNGTNGYIDIPKVLGETYLSNNWTIKLLVFCSGAGYIWWMGNSGMYVNSATGNFQVYYYDGSGDRAINAGTGLFLQNTWNLFTWVKTSSVGQSLFVNGKLVGTEGSNTNHSTSYSTGAIGCVNFNNSRSGYYSGKIDEVSICNHVLSTSEKNLYSYYKGYYGF